jgi:hypothetical protein
VVLCLGEGFVAVFELCFAGEGVVGEGGVEVEVGEVDGVDLFCMLAVGLLGSG